MSTKTQVEETWRSRKSLSTIGKSSTKNEKLEEKSAGFIIGYDEQQVIVAAEAVVVVLNT